MMKQRIQLGGDDVKSYHEIFKKATDFLIRTISFDGDYLKQFQLMSLAKLLCYKKGKPTYMTLDEISRAIPEFNKKEISEMLEVFLDRKLVQKKTIDDIDKYYLTKMADEFGEIVFPLLIWAFKYC